MGKRVLLWLFGCCFLLTSWHSVFAAQSVYEITKEAGYTVEEKDAPKSSLIADGYNGQILWQEEADLIRDPASIAKVMSVYLVMEAIERGELSLDSTIVATREDAAMASIYALSNNAIVEGVAYPVSDLIKMTLVASSNAATIMLSRAIAPTDGDFIRMLNEKASELGMTRTHFFNASGAAAELFNGLYQPEGIDPAATNESTARDLAVLAIDFWRRFPEVTEYTRLPSVTVMEGTPYEETFQTYNYSVPGSSYGMEGIVGLKTGSSGPGAFNYVALYEKDGLRLVEVILGVGNWAEQQGEQTRHAFGNALLSHVLQQFSFETLLDQGPQTVEGETILLREPLQAVVPSNWQPNFYRVGNYVVYRSSYEVLNAQQRLPSALIETPIARAEIETEMPPTVQSVSWYEKILSKFRHYFTRFNITLGVGVLLFLWCVRRFLKGKRKRRQQRQQRRSHRRRK